MFGLSGLYLKLVEIGIALLIVGGGYWWIGHHAVENYKDELKIEQAEADRKQMKAYNELSEKYEVQKGKREVVFKTITRTVEKVVERPVYKVICIDTEGLEAANKALGGKDE